MKYLASVRFAESGHPSIQRPGIVNIQPMWGTKVYSRLLSINQFLMSVLDDEGKWKTILPSTGTVYSAIWTVQINVQSQIDSRYSLVRRVQNKLRNIFLPGIEMKGFTLSPGTSTSSFVCQIPCASARVRSIAGYTLRNPWLRHHSSRSNIQIRFRSDCIRWRDQPLNRNWPRESKQRKYCCTLSLHFIYHKFTGFRYYQGYFHNSDLGTERTGCQIHCALSHHNDSERNEDVAAVFPKFVWDAAAGREGDNSV
jgi:hypothetical protein